ncbi:6-O-methylguanine DNA methyltransferase [Neohortaea acidophila]|uniref:Methylated-DNA--protein-cysteine methyltransferase n=1 Tax=Neohortaea acidophila TaxID=245834 RepID=A0A6A6PZ65_9PEZI|nr:6-O-methylguanine DNA methyltransferase [Neohortaea acidophila]KAF2484743.1 6-O-methylguanine DNA methyltransferase [Neohortaea acidophila]
MRYHPATLRNHWTLTYTQTLPALARAKDPVQPHWPVHLDHCFARIILDNAVGIDRPWTEVVKAPAVKHMNPTQLKEAWLLGRRICEGRVDLGALNERSLELRGKGRGAGKRKAEGEVSSAGGSGKKRRTGKDGTVSSYFLPTSPAKAKASTEQKGSTAEPNEADTTHEQDTADDPVDIPAQLRRIQAAPDLTPFRKQALTLLCQIPRGRYSTYQALSDHITATSHPTCARAVGSAMRNNPFAPEVPCHRVLANDGSLGGFKGEWGEGGKFASKKHELLFEEGVRFDSRGKVKGPVFREFGGSA